MTKPDLVETVALKPCPFCGSEGEELGLCYETGQTPAEGRDWFVRCYVCHVETAREDTEAQTIATWNTRAALPGLAPASDLQAENERLRGALQPFIAAAELYFVVCRNWSNSGQTEAERRFSEGEREDTALEAAISELRPEHFRALAALSEPQAQAGREADCDCCGRRGPIAYREADTGALVCDRCAPLTTEGGE